MDRIRMGLRGAARRAACALCIAVMAMLIALSSCSDALINEMNRLATEANLPTISPANNTTITAHETITLALPNAEVGAKIEYLGSIWQFAPGSTSLGADKKLVLVSGGAPGKWKAGSGENLVIRVTSAGQTVTYTYTYDVFNGVCVSSPSSPRSPGATGAPGAPGTWLNPLDTIQAGIDKATTTYVGGPAEVRVALCPISSPYSASCAVFNAAPPVTATYVVDMIEGVSVKGGYALDFSSRNPAGTPSYIKDISTDAVHSTTANPVRAVNISGAITIATVLDGFTITLGAGGGLGTAHTGIACLSGASPTISNVTVLGRADSERSNEAYGIYLSGSSAAISGCSIDPGSAVNQSIGINTASAATCTPTIQNSAIGGGKSIQTTGILLNGNVNATVSANSVNGGNWTISGGPGACLFLETANTTNATITGNTLTPFDLAHSNLTYGVYLSDTTPVSDPHQLRTNDFNYDGAWYFFEVTGTTIGSGNYTSVSVTTGEGTALLFNATWGNHSTAKGLP